MSVLPTIISMVCYNFCQEWAADEEEADNVFDEIDLGGSPDEKDLIKNTFNMCVASGHDGCIIIRASIIPLSH